MSDLFIFLFGTLVSLFCAAAVGLLVWGAAHEPRPGEPYEAERRAERKGTGV